jgi:hypothetical protein
MKNQGNQELMNPNKHHPIYGKLQLPPHGRHSEPEQHQHLFSHHHQGEDSKILRLVEDDVSSDVSVLLQTH